MSSRDPRSLEARVVGAQLVNGTLTPYPWAMGGTRREQARPRTGKQSLTHAQLGGTGVPRRTAAGPR